ncbi:ester cyclase [Dinoroseobacter sp. S76]|uniref:nuclear transport factor 2 family protein n=1 Tax=Dinoroseobacter sp. S76 TaxID=3415124 RepID=UPI003C7D290B
MALAVLARAPQGRADIPDSQTIMTQFQTAKARAQALFADLDAAGAAGMSKALARHVAPDWHWRGVAPFHEQTGAEDVSAAFWTPLAEAMPNLHRRQDVFFAGESDLQVSPGIWVCSMGHLTGLFDRDFLDIPATGRLTWLRYAEFHKVEGDVITESATFIDILSLMHQAGVYPLPPSTGAMAIYPGPRTHDGLLTGPHDPAEGAATLNLIERMVADLSALNLSGNDRAGIEMLQKTWHDDMSWYGPYGIGATQTLPRYQEQHTFPFRLSLGNKTFNGHVARLAEGNYGAFFGWPNLTNTTKGGFLGLPGSGFPADMRVVDVYRREGDKLAENWVFIDMLHYLQMQGLDVLERNRQLRRISHP